MLKRFGLLSLVCAAILAFQGIAPAQRHRSKSTKFVWGRPQRLPPFSAEDAGSGSPVTRRADHALMFSDARAKVPK